MHQETLKNYITEKCTRYLSCRTTPHHANHPQTVRPLCKIGSEVLIYLIFLLLGLLSPMNRYWSRWLRCYLYAYEENTMSCYASTLTLLNLWTIRRSKAYCLIVLPIELFVGRSVAGAIVKELFGLWSCCHVCGCQFKASINSCVFSFDFLFL